MREPGHADAAWLPDVFLLLSQRPGVPAQAAAPVAPGVVGLSDAEQRLIAHYRAADPDDQADIYQAARAAARKAKEARAELIRDADVVSNTG